ncbi:MAG: carboxypeptidase-like regulatory domain-containing protein [Chitinophagaceae bacterium]
MKKLFLIIFVTCYLCTVVIAQTIITGCVTEAGTTKPVTAATVFVSNSSAGTFTNDKGLFNLTRPAAGKFTLVVSCIGYETLVKYLQVGTNIRGIVIELTRKAADLDEVIVTPAEKNGWITWGDLFIEHFIGNSSYGRNCKIKNPKVLKFRRNERDNFLTVSANAPIIIENKSLGYTIRYDLKEFKYYFTENTVFYSGYALFEETGKANDKMKLKYKETRAKVYAVSLLHFMRSLYTETTEAEGFRILRKINKKVIEVRNASVIAENGYSGIENYDTIYEISNTNTQIRIVANENNHARSNIDGNSTNFSSMRNIMFFSNKNALLNFRDTLQVVYTKSNPPSEYVKYATDGHNNNVIVSEISLIQPGPISVMPNGSFEPTNLAMNGFWGWWEKISIMLPYDYQPE